MNALPSALRDGVEPSSVAVVEIWEKTPNLDMSSALRRAFATAGTSIPVASVVMNEAVNALREYDRWCKPVIKDVIFAWLQHVNFGVGAPLQPFQFGIRASALSEAIFDLPEGVFSKQTAREMMLANDLFPGAKALLAILSPHAKTLLSTRNALRGVVVHEATSRPSRPKDPAERERIVKGFRKQMTSILPGLPPLEPVP